MYFNDQKKTWQKPQTKKHFGFISWSNSASSGEVCQLERSIIQFLFFVDQFALIIELLFFANFRCFFAFHLKMPLFDSDNPKPSRQYKMQLRSTSLRSEKIQNLVKLNKITLQKKGLRCPLIFDNNLEAIRDNRALLIQFLIQFGLQPHCGKAGRKLKANCLCLFENNSICFCLFFRLFCS